MKLTELQVTMRRNIVEHLRLLASPEEQRQYQRDVPFVNISGELLCGWFDDYYVPESQDFCSAFSPQELAALSEFNQVFDTIVESTFRDGELPQIEDLIKMAEWKRLSHAACATLNVFENKTLKAK